MSRYAQRPLTSKEAEAEERKVEARAIAEAQRKSEAYSRLVANADFRLFLEAIDKSVGKYLPMGEFAQGRLDLWNQIADELNHAHGAAKLIASLTEKRLEESHKVKVFRMEQKGK